jgi:hypothetical protein
MSEVGQVPGPQEVADRMAITDVIHRYARGIDRANADILKSTCWPDAELDYGTYQGPAHPFCDALSQGLKRFFNTQHQVSKMIIEIDGDSANVETYLTAHHYNPVEEGGKSTEMTYIGRYLDQMEKRDNVWKIKFRKIAMTWHQNAETSEDFDSNPSLVPIARATNDEDDPLFAFLDGNR